LVSGYSRQVESVLDCACVVSVSFVSLLRLFAQVLQALRKDTGVRHNLLRTGSFQGRVKSASSFISRTRSRSSSVGGDDSDLEGPPKRSSVDYVVRDDEHWRSSSSLQKPLEKPNVKWELADSQKVCLLACERRLNPPLMFDVLKLNPPLMFDVLKLNPPLMFDVFVLSVGRFALVHCFSTCWGVGLLSTMATMAC
jgi:hypothetical protein